MNRLVGYVGGHAHGLLEMEAAEAQEKTVSAAVWSIIPASDGLAINPLHKQRGGKKAADFNQSKEWIGWISESLVLLSVKAYVMSGVHWKPNAESSAQNEECVLWRVHTCT